MKHNDRVILSATKWSRRISFVLGLSSFALFAACTDYVGEIDDQIDELKELQARVESQKSSSSEEEEPVTSSSSLDEIVKHPSSSSRGDVLIITKPSSSSLIIIDDPELSSSSITVIKSSSSITIINNPVPESSSEAEAEIVMVTGLGSCAPVSTPINKGSSVKWKFSGNLSAGYKAIDFAKATFAWNFPSGLPASDATPSTSAAITFPTSGTASATLTLTMQDGKSETIQCSPLQVNGEPITCDCAVTGGDITDDQGVAIWTAACTSQANITSYTWDGVDLGADAASYQYVFQKKGEAHTPTLSVANDDNTVQTVNCPAMVASDSMISYSSLGSCAPVSTPINKGSSVRWKFSGNLSAGYKAIDFAKATFAWSFPGGSPAADATPSTSATITYANSGAARASLTLTMQDGFSEVIPCSPLQVNGDPISCTCIAAGGDIVENAGVATWTATCTSASEITSYIWDGTDAGETGTTFSYTFAAKGDTHTPTLEVGNSDGTVETVTCPAMTATDASKESD